MLIAALNEQEGIGPTIEELRKVLVNPYFLVVDGNSTDRTVEIAKDFGAVVIPQKGTGKGDAVAVALSHLDGEAFDYVVLIDADFTYPAEFLPRMIQILEENPDVGMVCGNRFNSHLHVKSMRNAFYFGNRLLAFTHNLLNGVSLRDPLTGLRVVRAEALRDWLPKSKGFDVEVELNHHVERRGYGIREIDIAYRPRLGEKKLKLKHGLTIMKRILVESMY
ncbi:MAG: glycosyltransferase family 2 protein [Candidatus Bathyarchaeota archaeon]|nr:glycosyltransferase family 2 protein [Candidatus Bathyarchaeota archaeon]